MNIIDTISGGIFTARPWVAGGALSEGDESEEENVEKLQGIIRFGALKENCSYKPTFLGLLNHSGRTLSGLTPSDCALCMKRTFLALARYLQFFIRLMGKKRVTFPVTIIRIFACLFVQIFELALYGAGEFDPRQVQ